ncbi:MAG: aspartate 1-decarboxylase [Deltaproteobacteria bacterium]|nr:aspartate 1-decarboxylase [Deltaproteobacteria bacterium]
MYIGILKSKIHRARVTEADLHYEGSCTISRDLMKAANLVDHEHVHIWNVNRGTRFETYVIPAPQGSGIIKINGAAAHQAKKGDLVIICSFGHMTPAEAKKHKPKIVFVDDQNRVKRIASKSGSADPMPIL